MSRRKKPRFCESCEAPLTTDGHPKNPSKRDFCRSCSHKAENGYQHPGNSTRTYHAPPVRRLSDVEAAWLGALVEGEGSITLRAKVNGVWVTAGVNTLDRLEVAEKIAPHQLVVYSTDVELISACLRLTQVGNVYYRAPRPDYVSPNGRRAFAKKDSWQWDVRYAVQLAQLLPQIAPYLTRKKLLARMGTPIQGSSCHPSHFEAPAPAGMSEEQIAKNWEGYNKGKGIDPRAIDKHFKFKPGHEPDYLEGESGWHYVDVKFEGEDADPDQRDMLHGGPVVAMDCDRCGTQLHAVGRMSSWEVMNQPGVSLVNIDRMDEARRKELQEEKVVILACPNCKKKWQWLEEFLPKGAYDAQE